MYSWMSRKLPLLFCIIFCAQSATAYTLTQADSGKPIRWRYGQKLYLAGNPTGQDGLSSDFFYQSVISALQQWKWASRSQFDFEYWQGIDPKTYVPSLSQKGTSTIFFASNSDETSDPNIIGFTQTWFNNNTGDLIETNIMINDRNFKLTDKPEDTSANAHPSQRPNVYLGNIITHELGHALGLSHSGSLSSSMLYVEYPEQSKIACDDLAAVRHLYPSEGVNLGSLRGRILSPVAEPVPGALVNAISKKRGVVLASVLTDQRGQYDFGALDEGEVGIAVQAFQGSNNSVPEIFRSRMQTLCANGSYPTQFLREGDSPTLQSFLIQTGKNLDAGTYRLQCDEVGAIYSSSGELAPSDFFVAIAQAGVSQTYSFMARGAFSISSVAYQLLSSVKLKIQVSDSNGAPVRVATEAPLYQSPSHFLIPDTRVTGWAEGILTVKLTPTLLPSSDFPIPSLNPTRNPFFILAFSTGPDGTPASDARCTPPETFALYQSPDGNPVRNAATTPSRDGIGFCGGSAQASGFKNPRPHAPTPLSGIAEWFFPFWVALATRLYSKHRQAKLLKQ